MTIANTTDTDGKYMTYFQSIITLGVMNNASDSKNAINMAKKVLVSENGVNYCVFDQTDFELAGVEELSGDYDPQPMSVNIPINDKIKNVIATRMHIPVEDLTDDHYRSFISDSISSSLIDDPLS